MPKEPIALINIPHVSIAKATAFVEKAHCPHRELYGVLEGIKTPEIKTIVPCFYILTYLTSEKIYHPLSYFFFLSTVPRDRQGQDCF